MKYKKCILYVTAGLIAIVLSAVVTYFECAGNLWGLSLLLWIIGVIVLVMMATKEAEKGINELRKEASDEGIFCAIGTIVITFAYVLAPLFVNGFSSFHIWDAYSAGSIDKGFWVFMFNYCITAVASCASLLVLIPICAIILPLPVTIIGHIFFGKSGDSMSHGGSNAGLTCALFAYGFIVLSQLCGAVDYFQYLGIAKYFMD